MKASLNPQEHTALRIAAAYVVFGAFWVAVSDRVIEALVADLHRMTVIQTFKGWAFVAASTLLLYLAVRRELKGRAQVEDALRGREVLHRALAESAQDLVFIAGRDETIQYVNPAGARYLGRTVEEIGGNP